MTNFEIQRELKKDVYLVVYANDTELCSVIKKLNQYREMNPEYSYVLVVVFDI